MKELKEGARKIILAEKDEEVRHLLSEFLKLQGYEVQEIERPAGIRLEEFREPPDLFLLGHGTSEEETFDVLETVRGEKAFEGTPVIVIAVEPDEGFVTEAVSRGADGLVPFPFSMEELHRKIEDLLDGRRTPMMP